MRHMKADGSDVTQLTTDPGTDQTPSFSPDGSRIAYISLSEDFVQDIWVMNADGSGQTNITNHPAFDDFPAFRGSR